MRHLITAIVTAAIMTAAPAIADDSSGRIAPEYIPEYIPAKLMRFMNTPCPSEDAGTNCYWNARTMGNGQGRSFYVIPIGDKVCIRYWNRTYDRNHGRCYRNR